MATARVFKSGNSQAVRLPKQFRFKSREVKIFRRGNEIVLREEGSPMSRALICWRIFRTISFREAERTSRRNAGKGSNERQISAGYEYLHLYPPESSTESTGAISQTPAGRGRIVGDYLR